VLKALAASLGFAYAAHSPVLSVAAIPAVAAFAVASAAYTVHALRRTKVAR
jgi:hypothetical protein